MNEENISESLEFDAILIDTSIYDRYGLKLDKGLLKSLHQFKRSPADLLLPDVIHNEIKAHLSKKIGEIINLNKLISEFKEYSLADNQSINLLENLNNNIDLNIIVNEKIDSFIENTGTVLIECGDFITISEILDKYFTATPPFAKDGKKKNEFPDAIVLNAVEAWASQNNKKVLAVAADTDWKSFCDSSNRIKYTEDLTDVLAKFNTFNAPYVALHEIEKLIQTQNEDFHKIVADLLTSEVSNLDPHPTADSYLYWEPESISTWFESFEFLENECRIIETDTDRIVIEAQVNITIGAEAEFSLSVYDSIDRDYIGISGAVESVEKVFDSKILLTFEGEVTTDQSLENLELTDIEILTIPSTIDFGTLEPIFEDEDY